MRRCRSSSEPRLYRAVHAGYLLRRRARLDQVRAKLDETPFPPSTLLTRQTPRWKTGALTVALLALGVVAAVLRLGWPASLDTVSAEDGPSYLQGALTEGPWETISAPYAGYRRRRG